MSRGLPGDPGEVGWSPGWEAYEVGLRGLGGRSVGVDVWSIEGVEAGGPVVLATMGWADSRIGALVRLGGEGSVSGEGLATRASRVIAWDAPGQGEAAGRCGLGTEEPELILGLVEHAVEQWGGGERGVVLFGSSLGAGASVVAASLAEGAVREAVVGVVAESPYRLPVPPARNVLRAGGYPAFVLPALYVWFGWRLGVGVREDWPRAHRGLGFDRVVHAGRLSCPLLVIHGDEDGVSPFEDGEAMAAAARECGSGGELVRVSGAGHNDLWTDPRFGARVGEVVAGFVGRVSRGDGAVSRGAAAGR